MNNQFEPDYDDLQFTIEIKVYKNCTKTEFTKHNINELTYHHAMGALATVMQHNMFLQSGINVAAFKEWEKKNAKLKKELSTKKTKSRKLR